MIVTQYITRSVLWVYMVTQCSIHHNGIIQKPHDHLFQKSEASGFNMGAKKANKNRQILGFFFKIVTKYLTRWVLRVYLVTLCAIHHNGIIQKPYDHLYQKSGASGFNLSALTRKQTKIVKCKVFFFMIVTKYVTRQVLWVNLFTLFLVHHIGITQKPHDHLF